MQKFIIRDKCSRYCLNKKQCKLGTCGNGNYELQVPNNEFPFGWVVFCRRRYLSMQRQSFCLSGSNCSDVFVRRSVTCGYQGYCLSGKSKPVNRKLRLRWISVFEGVFGLKSRIFIRNYKLSISNYECDHLHFSICDYLREPIYFFSR